MSDTPLVQLTKRAYNLGLKAVSNFIVLSSEMIAYYEQHLEEIPDAVFRGFTIPEIPDKKKFTLFSDLGTIVVPDGYDHATCLEKFRKAHREKLIGYNENTTDANFSHVTNKLVPGRTLRVLAWRQIASVIKTSDEHIAFLAMQNSILVGAQGVTLVFSQKKNQLPRGYWYYSFDEKKGLWKDAEGYHRVPGVFADNFGRFAFGLSAIETTWLYNSVFLSFHDEPVSSAGK